MSYINNSNRKMYINISIEICHKINCNIVIFHLSVSGHTKPNLPLCRTNAKPTIARCRPSAEPGNEDINGLGSQ